MSRMLDLTLIYDIAPECTEVTITAFYGLFCSFLITVCCTQYKSHYFGFRCYNEIPPFRVSEQVSIPVTKIFRKHYFIKIESTDYLTEDL